MRERWPEASFLAVLLALAACGEGVVGKNNNADARLTDGQVLSDSKTEAASRDAAPPGPSCAADSDCQSGNTCECADASCVARVCNAVECPGCTFTAGGGGCGAGNIAAGQDPNEACALACNGSGSCQVADGQACSADSDCQSGHTCECADASCAARVCNAVECLGCTFTAGGGGCGAGNIAEGQDPNDACALACDGQGQCQVPIDCSGIAANPSYELCESSADHCAGVFTNGAGCLSYCAAAGLVCTARFGGDAGCVKEANLPIACAVNNGNLIDWCECGRGQVNTTCNADPANPPVHKEMHFNSATYDPRSSWVLQCRDYAYTAQYAEHEACDSLYQSGSGRGKATFVLDAPRGQYDVFIEGRHTENRNSAGARVVVSSAGQSYVVFIDQRDDAGIVADLHGRYCLEGTVTVVVDSSVSTQSDSVRRVILEPVN